VVSAWENGPSTKPYKWRCDIRKTTLLLVALPIVAGSAFYYLRAQQPKPLTIGVTTPLEVVQVILPEAHPEFPPDTAWVHAHAEHLPIKVPVPLRFPASWQLKYEVRIEDDTVYYDYVHPRKSKLFSITALTEAGWQAVRGGPQGKALFSYGGIVWIYDPAQDAFCEALMCEYEDYPGRADQSSRLETAANAGRTRQESSGHDCETSCSSLVGARAAPAGVRGGLYSRTQGGARCEPVANQRRRMPGCLQRPWRDGHQSTAHHRALGRPPAGGP
jgi:hypothetical protein